MAIVAIKNAEIYASNVPSSLFNHRINLNRCEGCGICVAVCPFDCIAMPHLVPYYVPHRAPLCIRCEACRSACPREAIIACDTIFGKFIMSSDIDKKSAYY